MISQKSLKVIGVSKEISDRWITELMAPHRHYHTLAHIAHIIQEYDTLGMTQREIYAAAWLHDIRYDATRKDNEEVSAEIAKEDLQGTSVDIPLVVDIILDTKYHQGGAPILDLFSDLDMSILGSRQITYDHYMVAIRREYAHVPLTDYAAGRAKVLRGFDDSVIFKTDHFASREKDAHRNLQREIELLENSPHLIEAMSK
jgi:predicted metal-dependent HD superfamily phosphohydrolase